MGSPSRFLILISNEKMTTRITTRHQPPSGSTVPASQPPPGPAPPCTSITAPAPVHLGDLIRHLCSLPSICRTVTCQECKTLRCPGWVWGPASLPPAPVRTLHALVLAEAPAQRCGQFPKSKPTNGPRLWWRAAQALSWEDRGEEGRERRRSVLLWGLALRPVWG